MQLYNPERSDMPPPTIPKKNPAAQALGRLGGQANTKAQNRARKQNAQQAGRPRRICTHCGEPVVGGHADRALDDTCGRHGWRWERAGTGVPAPPSKALQLIREAIDALNNQGTKINLKDWTREARKLLASAK